MNLSRLIPAAALGLAATLSLHAEMADGIMAIVDDKAITYEQVNDYASPSSASSAAPESAPAPACASASQNCAACPAAASPN